MVSFELDCVVRQFWEVCSHVEAPYYSLKQVAAQGLYFRTERYFIALGRDALVNREVAVGHDSSCLISLSLSSITTFKRSD